MKSTDLRRLLSTSSGRRLFFVSCFSGLFWSALVLGNAYLIAEIIVRITRHEPGQLRYIAWLAGLWAVRALFQSQFDFWCSKVASTMKQELRTATTASPANYEDVAASRLSNVLTKGLNSLDIYLGRFIPQMIFATITPLAVIAVIFSQDLISGFIALITLPLIPLFGALIGRFSEDAVSKKWRTLGTLSTYFEDSLRGFITLKIFNRSKSQAARIGKMGDTYSDETMKVLRISFLSAFALELIATLSVAVIAVSIGLRLVSGEVNFRTALVVLILAPEVYFPVRNAASLFHASQDGTEAMHELDAIQRPARAPIEKDLGLVTGLSWQDWKFLEDSYIPAGKLSQGQMLFLVGNSGAGKTTFSKNLLGLAFDTSIHLETSSTVIELSAEMAREWRTKVGWIPQIPHLASGSVRRQFTLIDPRATDDDIEIALGLVGLSLADLPNGLESVLGRGGEASHSASGGQIRRIAVARALFRDPQFIVADEPTADLDQKSADTVMAALRFAQRNGAMVICITHDSDLVLPGDHVCRVERVEP